MKKNNAVQDRLVDGEHIIAQADIHWGIYWQSVAVFILGVLLLVFVAPNLGYLLFVTAALMAIYATIKKSILLLVVTNKRVLARYGILQVDVVDLHFDKMESIELERMPPGMIMGYANVVLMGTGQRYIVIPFVSNGPEIRRKYNEVVLSK